MNDFDKEITTLVKSTSTLVTLVTAYLLITWGYQAISFVFRTLIGV